MLTNPDCWKTCPNMNEAHTGDRYPYDTHPLPNIWTTGPQKINVKKVTKTIEKYGPDGTYLGKEIVTEETYDEVPSNPWGTAEPYTITVGDPPYGSYTINGVISTPISGSFTTNLNDVNVNDC
jgi:hypothetical protein